MANNFVYLLDGKAYINLTNKCGNACTFCIRNSGDGVAGTPLWLDREPTADEVMSAFDSASPREKEVVFCGYGEPTCNLDTLVEVAARLKKAGYCLRLNTNGLGNAENGRDIAPLLKDFDAVSVSLNNCDAHKYAEITRSKYGEKAFGYVLEFAEACKAQGLNVVFTVVDVIGEDDIAACGALCDKLGIPLRVRSYIADNYDDRRE